MSEGASAIADQEYAHEARRLSKAHFARLRSSPFANRLMIELAPVEARALNADHVGTEHVTLALFALGPSRALDALRGSGVTREKYLAVLAEEPGPSPEGHVPYTDRAMMICALAAAEAEAEGASDVAAEHFLLGVIRESRRWAESHEGGPRHLEAAAASVGSSLAEMEDALRAG